MKTFERNSNIVLTRILEEYLLIALRTDGRKKAIIRQLNASGANIWKLLESGKSEAEIIDIIQQQNKQISKERIAFDIQVFLQSLCDNGFLHESSFRL